MEHALTGMVGDTYDPTFHRDVDNSRPKVQPRHRHARHTRRYYDAPLGQERHDPQQPLDDTLTVQGGRPELHKAHPFGNKLFEQPERTMAGSQTNVPQQRNSIRRIILGTCSQCQKPGRQRPDRRFDPCGMHQTPFVGQRCFDPLIDQLSARVWGSPGLDRHNSGPVMVQLVRIVSLERICVHPILVHPPCIIEALCQACACHGPAGCICTASDQRRPWREGIERLDDVADAVELERSHPVPFDHPVPIRPMDPVEHPAQMRHSLGTNRIPALCSIDITRPTDILPTRHRILRCLLGVTGVVDAAVGGYFVWDPATRCLCIHRQPIERTVGHLRIPCCQ